MPALLEITQIVNAFVPTFFGSDGPDLKSGVCRIAGLEFGSVDALCNQIKKFYLKKRNIDQIREQILSCKQDTRETASSFGDRIEVLLHEALDTITIQWEGQPEEASTIITHASYHEIPPQKEAGGAQNKKQNIKENKDKLCNEANTSESSTVFSVNNSQEARDGKQILPADTETISSRAEKQITKSFHKKKDRGCSQIKISSNGIESPGKVDTVLTTLPCKTSKEGELILLTHTGADSNIVKEEAINVLSVENIPVVRKEKNALQKLRAQLKLM
ncbi:hypothetical protein EVAR_91059_1 [Eumeta japonica]|uniref:Uncharacterized protein n=1 Tax=Eumeta variegata TaxID=151549 RepID=A0A4C1SF78_EUMVA|nr:hypothetical protein EVAR_91059_1 [Eumeta japonica]